MGEDKTTHSLVTKRGLRKVNTDKGGQKYTHPTDEHTKGGV